MRMPPYKHVCSRCGKIWFSYHKSRKYCGRECYEEARRVKHNKICPQCEEPFISNRIEQKYCSKECYYLSQRGTKPLYASTKISLTCITCDREFVVFPREAQRKYCSKECYYNRPKHKRDRNGTAHIYRIRDKSACQICEETRLIEACHIVPSHEDGKLTEDNVLFLCPTHHKLLDRNLLTKEEFDKIKDLHPHLQELYKKLEFKRSKSDVSR